MRSPAGPGAAPAPPLLQVSAWQAIPHLLHGFLGRRGGVSVGPFAELNLSDRVGDAAEAVQENWRRVSLATTGQERFVSMQQVHGPEAVTVGDPDAVVGETDAMSTNVRGILLSVLTADCVPILLVAPRERAVAVVHAGWRGTLAGVTERAVRHMTSAFGTRPADLQAALGPAIDGCCYEVERSIGDEMQSRWGVMHDAVRRTSAAKATVDLRRANRHILIKAGLLQTHLRFVGPCTGCRPGEYFSHRASGGQTGRQLSFIGWEGGAQPARA